ncbi:putative 18S rRNA (guanine-N(7))-methyltransferase [Capsicum annuum]
MLSDMGQVSGYCPITLLIGIKFKDVYEKIKKDSPEAWTDLFSHLNTWSSCHLDNTCYPCLLLATNVLYFLRQWLCNADKFSHESLLRLKASFGSLYGCLGRGARAVLQVYPENIAPRELILGFDMRAGFSGGIVVDYPHRKCKQATSVILFAACANITNCKSHPRCLELASVSEPYVG